MCSPLNSSKSVVEEIILTIVVVQGTCSQNWKFFCKPYCRSVYCVWRFCSDTFLFFLVFIAVSFGVVCLRFVIFLAPRIEPFFFFFSFFFLLSGVSSFPRKLSVDGGVILKATYNVQRVG